MPLHHRKDHQLNDCEAQKFLRVGTKIADHWVKDVRQLPARYVCKQVRDPSLIYILQMLDLTNLCLGEVRIVLTLCKINGK